MVGRDGLDACVYAGTTAPANKAPPVSKVKRPIPGDEYETATPPPPVASVDETPVEPPVSEDFGLEEAPVEEPVVETPDPVEPPLVDNLG